jgi:hypothetical protein
VVDVLVLLLLLPHPVADRPTRSAVATTTPTFSRRWGVALRLQSIVIRLLSASCPTRIALAVWRAERIVVKTAANLPASLKPT